MERGKEPFRHENFPFPLFKGGSIVGVRTAAAAAVAVSEIDDVDRPCRPGKSIRRFLGAEGIGRFSLYTADFHCIADGPRAKYWYGE